MARLVTVTAYAVNSTAFESASPMTFPADNIVRISNASLKAKMSVPAASGSINSAFVVDIHQDNSTTQSSYLIAETQATIVTASE